MKNSEMKTIIRHIDRLTRNLNARGRRRDAISEEERKRRVVERQRQKKTQNAVSGTKQSSIKALNDIFDIGNDCKFLFLKLAKRADFESIKEFAKKEIDSLKNVNKNLNQVIAFCNKGINVI